jgi:carbon monoxide dehydrogenase subunit G
MPLYRAEIAIDVPTARVWDALLDWEGSSRWMVPPTTVEIMGERTNRPGMRVHAVSRLGPLRLVDHMVVTDWEPEREIRVRHVGWPLRGDGIFRVEPDGTGARFVWVEDLVLPLGIVGELAGSLLKPLAERALAASCRNLKSTLES